MSDGSSPPATLPLQGVVVADFSRILAGPLCTMVLADLGADVIKIERPGTGDDTRTWGPPFVGDDAAYFLSINRNKRSIALDLGRRDGVATAREIVNRSDVLVENFRSDVMEGLGLDHESLASTNHRLIYCSMPAFSHPASRNRPGYDLMMQALSGFMSITGEPGGTPIKMGVALLDVVAGLYAAVGILAALRERVATGAGRRIEIGLFEASVAGLVNQAANLLIGGTIPMPSGSAHPNIVPYQAFTANDGQLVLAAANDKLFESTCRSIGRADLADDSRYATNAGRVEHREELVAELSDTFATSSVAEWLAILADAGVPAAPIRTLDQVFTSPEGRAVLVEAFDPIRGQLRFVKSPIDFGGDATVRPPPRLDEHRDDVLAWIQSTAPRGVH